MTLRLLKDTDAYEAPAVGRPGSPMLQIDELSPRCRVTVQGEPQPLDTSRPARHFGVTLLTRLLDDLVRPLSLPRENVAPEAVAEVDLNVRLRVYVGATPSENRYVLERLDVGDVIAIPSALVALDG